MGTQVQADRQIREFVYCKLKCLLTVDYNEILVRASVFCDQMQKFAAGQFLKFMQHNDKKLSDFPYSILSGPGLLEVVVIERFSYDLEKGFR